MIKYPKTLSKLIGALKRLPGVGNKSAERFAFHLLNWPSTHVEELAALLRDVKEQLTQCADCGCLMETERCSLCHDSTRDNQVICVVAYPKDIFAIELTHEYKGLYHVLGGVLSPMEGKNADQLTIPQLCERIRKLQVREVIIALDSTLEGDTTALYLKQELSKMDVAVLRLAFGLPMGSSLDYVDGGTLARAFRGRRSF